MTYERREREARRRQEAVKVAEADDWGEKRESRIIDCGTVPHRRGVHMWAFYGWASC